MVAISSGQRQYPEIWIGQRGAVTAREVMTRYNLKTEDAAAAMLDNLVRNRRLVKTVTDGVTRWQVP